MSLRIGFVGIGDIGAVMAKSILKAGMPLTVYDLNQEALRDLSTEGATAVNSCREVMEASDAVIIMVRDFAQTEAVVFGKEGLWEGARRGSVIILASTIGPFYPRELYNKARTKGVSVIDIGVTKRTWKNKMGQFTLMVSGDKDVIEQCGPVFNTMARRIFNVGEIGNAQAYKLINNMVAFNSGTVIRESLNVGLKLGLDMKKMLEIMQEGTGESWMARNLLNRINTGFKDSLPRMVDSAKPSKYIIKDQMLAIELADTVGAKVPVARLLEKLDESTVYDAYEKCIHDD